MNIKGIPEQIKFRLRALFFRLHFRPDVRLPTVSIGSKYGGWVIPCDLIKDNWIVYSGGVGTDASFDIGLITRFRCHVFAFDPTPKAISYAERIGNGNSFFHFYPFGLWSSDTQMKFFVPKNPVHVSHSVVNLQNTSEYFVAECKRLKTIMNDIGHERIDLLKIDIEGAEYEVLDSLIEDGIEVGVVCVEFDQPSPFSKTRQALAKLKVHGFKVVAIDRFNVTLVHERLIGALVT